MYLLSHLFLMLTQSSERAEKERSDAYLADATDLHDLEFRMRELDRGASRRASWMVHTE
ncbi:DUF3563 family protein [Burkholderia guangdongensis]|uniref:DUF3563 family protein n=1 Tax=Burkholderia guangdongensis TaxID=1792500 RepID=UPI0015CD76B4|nr:DUF3563 family protein [Burkholderia guangdongensis]